jgi:heat shock protein HtpX
MGVSNTVKTVFLLVLLAALFMAVGYAAGGTGGLTIAFVIALVVNGVSYWYSDKIVLRMHNAKPIESGDPSGVYGIVHELAVGARMSMPKVYRVSTPVPNAFATGRDPQHSAVAVTDGILRVLNKDELRAVLAHELSHIRNRDILISTVVAVLATAIMYLAYMLRWVLIFGGRRGDREGGASPLALLATIILAPLAAALLRAAVSRAREYMADESGADISADPRALAAALEKISDPRLLDRLQRERELSAAQSALVNLYIVNNFSGQTLLNLFSTHPPVEERIKRLRSMARR